MTHYGDVGWGKPALRDVSSTVTWGCHFNAMLRGCKGISCYVMGAVNPLVGVHSTPRPVHHKRREVRDRQSEALDR